MSTKTRPISLLKAQKILADFSCIDSKSVDSESEKPCCVILATLTSLSDYQNLGICADTAAQGFLALESYLKALGYEATLDKPISSHSLAQFILSLIQRKSHYLDSYTGKYRRYWCPANPCRTNQSTEPTVIYRSTYLGKLNVFAQSSKQQV